MHAILYAQDPDPNSDQWTGMTDTQERVVTMMQALGIIIHTLLIIFIGYNLYSNVLRLN